ncbi:MAG: class E sortase [Acidimicrobiales bacterium]
MTLTVTSAALVVAALVLIGFPVYTDLAHNNLQKHLSSQLFSPAERRAYLAGRVADGDSLTRIRIPTLGVDTVVVQGTDEKALRAGAGHYPTTPLPCAMGDVAIAGHRTTYGKPFSNVNLLAPGDQITLQTPVGSCVYRVALAPFVVPANDWGVVANTPALHTLTLTSCHPKGSASHRIVIKAQMMSSEQLYG